MVDDYLRVYEAILARPLSPDPPRRFELINLVIS
jgi:hypothetical protein